MSSKDIETYDALLRACNIVGKTVDAKRSLLHQHLQKKTQVKKIKRMYKMAHEYYKFSKKTLLSQLTCLQNDNVSFAIQDLFAQNFLDILVAEFSKYGANRRERLKCIVVGFQIVEFLNFGCAELDFQELFAEFFNVTIAKGVKVCKVWDFMKTHLRGPVYASINILENPKPSAFDCKHSKHCWCRHRHNDSDVDSSSDEDSSLDADSSLDENSDDSVEAELIEYVEAEVQPATVKVEKDVTADTAADVEIEKVKEAELE